MQTLRRLISAPKIPNLPGVCISKVGAFIIISVMEQCLVFKWVGVGLYWLQGVPREAQGPWGKKAMHRVGYVGDTMPGCTKKKLQPVTCVLFSQFEALEFQSS